MCSAVVSRELSALTPEPLCWYGLRTRSNSEKLVADLLGRKGKEQYLPLYKVRTKWVDRVVVAEKPLFPGYVFCRFALEDHLNVLKTRGVIEVIGFAEKLAPIDDGEIEAIRKALDSGLPVQSCEFLRTGQRVRILYGALKGIEGILIKKKAECRLVLSVITLHRSISVEIDGDAATAV